MNLIRKVAMAGVTLSVAIAAGQYVQHGVALPFGARAEAPPEPTGITLLSAGPAPTLVLPVAPEMPALPVLGRLPAAPQDRQAALVLPREPETPAPQTPTTCTAALELTAAPGALLKLALTAPCHRNERVVLRHAGLAVTARIGVEGSFSGTLPAMDRAGAVSVLLTDGSEIEAAAPVADMAGIRRFAVQWLAEDAFQIHVPAAQEDRLSRLGDATVSLPMMAEVYTFPPASTGGEAATLEAAITPATCGRELLGETLESRNGRSSVTELSVTMPDCAAVGDYLLLKNLPGDVSIAAAN